MKQKRIKTTPPKGFFVAHVFAPSLKSFPCLGSPEWDINLIWDNIQDRQGMGVMLRALPASKTLPKGNKCPPTLPQLAAERWTLPRGPIQQKQ